jgi:4'-phosphopantetheinyl transferase
MFLPPRTEPDWQLEDGDIHLWWIDLDRLRLIGDPASVLSEAERSRARQFRLELERERWIRSRSGVRMILGSYVGVLPSDVVFSYTQNGKPEISNQIGLRKLHFNVSHSGQMCGLAVTHVNPIGIDVEKVRSVPEALDIARTLFSDAQYASLLATRTDQRMRMFLRVWTENEACLKALGVGFGQSDSRRSIIESRERGNRDSIFELPWETLTADPNPDYCASVMLRAATRPRLRTFWVKAFPLSRD